MIQGPFFFYFFIFIFFCLGVFDCLRACSGVVLILSFLTVAVRARSERGEIRLGRL